MQQGLLASLSSLVYAANAWCDLFAASPALVKADVLQQSTNETVPLDRARSVVAPSHMEPAARLLSEVVS